jgi:PadR family transcriptional regulator, regulatory protein PadR
MASVERVTAATLDVLEVLLEAHREGRDIHGWEIKKATRRSGPTVYGVIDRLEDAGLIEGHWENQDPQAKGPRRRYYRFSGAGAATARDLLTERRGRKPPIKVPAPGWTLGVDHGWQL